MLHQLNSGNVNLLQSGNHLLFLKVKNLSLKINLVPLKILNNLTKLGKRAKKSMFRCFFSKTPNFKPKISTWRKSLSINGHCSDNNWKIKLKNRKKKTNHWNTKSKASKSKWELKNLIQVRFSAQSTTLLALTPAQRSQLKHALTML